MAMEMMPRKKCNTLAVVDAQLPTVDSDRTLRALLDVHGPVDAPHLARAEHDAVRQSRETKRGGTASADDDSVSPVTYGCV